MQYCATVTMCIILCSNLFDLLVHNLLGHNNDYRNNCGTACGFTRQLAPKTTGQVSITIGKAI